MLVSAAGVCHRLLRSIRGGRWKQCDTAARRIATRWVSVPAQTGYVTLTGQNFGANPTFRFGTQNATAVNSANSTQIQATAPASVVTGAVSGTAYFAYGSLAWRPTPSDDHSSGAAAILAADSDGRAENFYPSMKMVNGSLP